MIVTPISRQLNWKNARVRMSEYHVFLAYSKAPQQMFNLCPPRPSVCPHVGLPHHPGPDVTSVVGFKDCHLKVESQTGLIPPASWQLCQQRLKSTARQGWQVLFGCVPSTLYMYVCTCHRYLSKFITVFTDTHDDGSELN